MINKIVPTIHLYSLRQKANTVFDTSAILSLVSFSNFEGESTQPSRIKAKVSCALNVSPSEAFLRWYNLIGSFRSSLILCTTKASMYGFCLSLKTLLYRSRCSCFALLLPTRITRASSSKSVSSFSMIVFYT